MSNKPDTPLVVETIAKAIEMFRNAVLDFDADVQEFWTATEGPRTVERKYRNALIFSYPTGEKFFVMVTEIPGAGEPLERPKQTEPT